MNIIFDLDGTLIDSAVGIRESLKMAFIHSGIVAPGDNEIPIGPPILLTIKNILNEMHAAYFGSVKSEYQKIYAQNGINKIEKYVGIDKLLNDLHFEKHQMYIATVKAEVFAKEIVSNLDWKKYFKAVYGSDLAGKNVDKTDILNRLIENENLDPTQTFMVGDREHDVVAANKNNLISVAVLWGYGDSKELSEAFPKYQISKPSELLKLLSTFK